MEEILEYCNKLVKKSCGIGRTTNIRKQIAWWSEKIIEQLSKKKTLWQKCLSNKSKEHYDTRTYKQQR